MTHPTHAPIHLNVPAILKARWAPDQLALLGTDSDPVIARRLGVSRRTIVTMRQRLGIPAWEQDRGFAWTSELLARLGHESDDALAAAIGTTALVVARKRRDLGIKPPRRLTAAAARSEHPGQVFPAHLILQLGSMPDADLARLAGVSRQRVHAMRVRHNIPSHRPPK